MGKNPLTVTVVIFTFFLTGCGLLSRTADSDTRTPPVPQKDEVELQKRRPEMDGEWGLVFVSAKSRIAFLAKKKNHLRGCGVLARRHHTQSVVIDSLGPDKYTISGCQTIERDVYREGNDLRIDAWMGVPLGETAKEWIEKVRMNPSVDI